MNDGVALLKIVDLFNKIERKNYALPKIYYLKDNAIHFHIGNIHFNLETVRTLKEQITLYKNYNQIEDNEETNLILFPIYYNNEQ